MGPGTGRMLAAAGVAAAATVAIDQATKHVARRSFAPDEVRDVALDGRIAVGHVRNYGSAYGIVGAMPTWVPAAGTALIGAGLLALGHGSARPALAGAGAGLVIGGGLGNVIDRAHQGHVTDFLHATDAFGFFNGADVAINAGLALSGAALLLAARR